MGNSALLFRRRLGRHVGGHRLRRDNPPPSRSGARRDLDCGVAGAIISPILLDHGPRPAACSFSTCCAFSNIARPCRWARGFLAAFGVCAVPGLIALELHAHHIFAGTLDHSCAIAAGIFIFGSAIFGTLLATYTGVLIGATAIPAWFLHRMLLPIHFGTAGLGSAAGIVGIARSPNRRAQLPRILRGRELRRCC